MPEVARYQYHDKDCNVVYEIARIEPGEDGKSKYFKQYKVMPDGSRLSGKGVMDDVPRVPYMLPLLLKGIELKKTIYFVEGEKCANALIKLGLIATTRSEGCGAALDGGYADGFLSWFRGASEVVVLMDCDMQGRQSGAIRAKKFSDAGITVRLYDFDRKRSDGYDVADWLKEGHSVDELSAMVMDAPVFKAPVIERSPDNANSENERAPREVVAAKIYTLGDLLNEAVKRAEEGADGNGVTIQNTPWQPLDYALGGEVLHSGFSPEETVIWAGAPGCGKSAATWMVADHAAAHHPGVAVLASAEMGEIVAVQRLIALYTGITVKQQQAGKLSSHEWEKLYYAQKHLASRRIVVVGRDARDVQAFHKAVEGIAEKTQISCIVYDHINKCTQRFAGTRTRTDALEEVAETLANMAIEYQCVMHFLQHLNRLSYGQKPSLASLRDGGNTEGTANTVIFPYRKFPNGNVVDRCKGELILEKTRDGWTGSLPMKYTGQRYMWTSTEESSVWFERA